MNNYIIQISDIHFRENPNVIDKGRSPLKQLNAALKDIKKKFMTHENNLLFVITGDLVSDISPKSYALLSECLTEYIKSPIYVIPGNHDNPDLIKKNFVAKNIFHEKEFHFAEQLFILLDSSTPGKNLGSGRLLKNELSRVHNLLELNRNLPIHLFVHHPPFKFGAKWFQEICLENGEDLQSLINKFSSVKSIIFGHAHTQYTRYIKNCLYIGSPSCWIQFDHYSHEDLAYTNTLGGYNWYQFNHSDFAFGTNYFEV